MKFFYSFISIILVAITLLLLSCKISTNVGEPISDYRERVIEKDTPVIEKIIPIVEETTEEFVETYYTEPVKNVSPVVKKGCKYDNGLRNLADNKMEDLMNTGYWNHTNSDGCDFNCRTDRYIDEDVFGWVGENLYRGICSIEYAYHLWEMSPAHKEILDHDYDIEVFISRKYEEDRCYFILIRGLCR
jgi:hypothetical protein